MFWKCFRLANGVLYFVTCWLSWCGGMGRLDGAQGSRSRGEPQIMEWLRPSPRLFQTRALGHCSVMVCRMALRLSTRPRCWLQLLYSANTASTGLCIGGEALVVEITLQCIILYLHLHPGHGRARFCLHWVSFTLAKLLNITETVSARISARVKCKHTPSQSELFVHMLHVI